MPAGDGGRGPPPDRRSGQGPSRAGTEQRGLHLTVEDYLTGALRRFDWSALDPEDRGRIRRDWGLEGTGDSTLAGEVFEIRLDDGSTTEIRGKVERENETTVFLRKDGEILEVPKSRIVGRDEEELDVRDVYSPEQLMEQLYKDMRADENIDFDNLTANDHWQIASRAEWVGALEVAQEHYAACAADETYLKREVAAAAPRQRRGPPPGPGRAADPARRAHEAAHEPVPQDARDPRRLRREAPRGQRGRQRAARGPARRVQPAAD